MLFYVLLYSAVLLIAYVIGSLAPLGSLLVPSVGLLTLLVAILLWRRLDRTNQGNGLNGLLSFIIPPEGTLR